MQHTIKSAKRLVFKVGSALLVNEETGEVHKQWLTHFINDIVVAYQRQQQIIIVSSGAIALGRKHLNVPKTNRQLAIQQAAAAVGQIRLAHSYQEALSQHNISVAQILLTLEDSENRKRYLNARNTIERLLQHGVIPIINENDTVATAEICYGDNDRLAARIAQMTSADTLVLLSDVDGLYSADPRQDPNATLIPVVKNISSDIEAMASDSVTHYGSGGMQTKLAAAKIVMASGCRMVVTKGNVSKPISQIDAGAPCTWFIPSTTTQSVKKNWLAQHLKPAGIITIDTGAIHALETGRSLLPIGVVAIEGNFHIGDPVSILTENHQEIARGLSNYPAHEALQIMGHKSSDIESILGYQGNEELVHRDNLVILERK